MLNSHLCRAHMYIPIGSNFDVRLYVIALFALSN